MAQRTQNQSEPKIQVLEQGNIYFFYRPKVDDDQVEGMGDVQRFYLVLNPQEQTCYRLIAIGKKQLPEADHPGQRYWGFVETVVKEPEALSEWLTDQTYTTKTRGERTQPAARPAGEGVYAIARYGDHTRLAYILELPAQPQAVQDAFHIEPEASYIFSVKNPEQPSPQGTGLEEAEQADFPKKLQHQLGERRFSDVDPPDFLNYEGAEILLIGASPQVAEAMPLEPQSTRSQNSDMLQLLRAAQADVVKAPLLQGEWR